MLEAILTSLGGVGWTEGDLPTATSELSGTAPSSARLSGRSTGSLKKAGQIRWRMKATGESTLESVVEPSSLIKIIEDYFL